jgi:hypothetical protein
LCLILAVWLAGVPAAPPGPVARIDVTAVAGYLAPGAIEDRHLSVDRLGAPLGGISAGYYWSDHWKTELHLLVSTTDSGRGTVFERTASPSTRDAHFFFRHHIAALIHQRQFLRNAWIHPAVGLGVQVDRASVRHLTFGITPEMDELPDRVRTKAAVFATGTMKLYVSPKTYLQSGLVFGLPHGRRPFSLQVGVGRDW